MEKKRRSLRGKTKTEPFRANPRLTTAERINLSTGMHQKRQLHAGFAMGGTSSKKGEGEQEGRRNRRRYCTIRRSTQLKKELRPIARWMDP